MGEPCPESSVEKGTRYDVIMLGALPCLHLCVGIQNWVLMSHSLCVHIRPCHSQDEEDNLLLGGTLHWQVLFYVSFMHSSASLVPKIYQSHTVTSGLAT